MLVPGRSSLSASRQPWRHATPLLLRATQSDSSKTWPPSGEFRKSRVLSRVHCHPERGTSRRIRTSRVMTLQSRILRLRSQARSAQDDMHFVEGLELTGRCTYFAWNACSYSERIVLPPLVRQSFTRSSSALTGCLPNRISSKRSVIVVFSVMPFEASVGEYRPTIGFGTATA